LGSYKALAGDVILAGTNTIVKVDVDNRSSRKVGCISAALRVAFEFRRLTCDSQVDCITLCLVERQQLTSSSSTKTHEKVVYQSQVFVFPPNRHLISISTSPPLAIQTPTNEASSAVAAKSHAQFQYAIRPPRGSFSILAGKSLHISYFVEFKADIALSTGLVHRIPGVVFQPYMRSFC
jgi:hypothetical protein